MEKENKKVLEKTKIGTTKIPVLKEKCRLPLKAISDKPNTSGLQETRISRPITADLTKYVTIRPKNEKLDWDFKVFNDIGVTSSSSGHDRVNENDLNEARFLEEKDLINGECTKVTPGLPPRVKNIKASLKRPHSRELQGIVDSGMSDREEKHKRRITFLKSPRRSQCSDILENNAIKRYGETTYTEEIFRYLQRKTKDRGVAVPQISTSLRACVINWLIKVNGANGNPAVVQTARWYFDTVSSKCMINLENFQVIAAACFWIAQKIHGCTAHAKKLVKYSSEAFNVKLLLDAEKKVLWNLEYPLQPVIPQEFITYLSWFCDNDTYKDVEFAATFLCEAGMMVDKQLCKVPPSIIGLASVENATTLLRKFEEKAKLITNPIFQSANKSLVSRVCLIQTQAVETLYSSDYRFTALKDFYGAPPRLIAEKIIFSIRYNSILTNGRHS